MKAQDIISYVRDIKNSLGTNDPYAIAEHFGIHVITRTVPVKVFTAQTIKINGYPTVISINNAYSASAQRVLCAHELGHALLHSEHTNYFAITNTNVHTTVEPEANLFAIALLGEDDIDSELAIPLAKLNSYMLKSIVDYNLEIPKK